MKIIDQEEVQTFLKKKTKKRETATTIDQIKPQEEEVDQEVLGENPIKLIYGIIL